MTILMLTTDLMFSSRVTGSADAQDVVARVAASTDALLAQADATEDLRLVIVDLTSPGCDPARIVSHLKQHTAAPTVVAYAPHIQVARLEQAKQAGCDRVLTRGQFDNNLNALILSTR